MQDDVRQEVVVEHDVVGEHVREIPSRSCAFSTE